DFGTLHVARNFVEDREAVASSAVDEHDAGVFRAAGVENFARDCTVLGEESQLVLGTEGELECLDGEVSDAQRGVASVLENEGFAAGAVRCVEGVDGGDFERDVVVLEADGKGVAAAGVCGSCVEELEMSAIAGAWCAVAVERELGAGFGDVSAGEQQ